MSAAIQTAFAKEAVKRPTYQRAGDLLATIAELEATGLGSELLLLLSNAARAWEPKERENNRRRLAYQPELDLTPEERLALRLLESLGPPEDCYLIADTARSIIEADQ